MSPLDSRSAVTSEPQLLNFCGMKILYSSTFQHKMNFYHKCSKM
uniref:Uncharacterized protein n=1 Tax=Rhizophora mucronata TaxID=61149 RepID=A0A2P2MX99_RHIMU